MRKSATQPRSEQNTRYWGAPPAVVGRTGAAARATIPARATGHDREDGARCLGIRLSTRYSTALLLHRPALTSTCSGSLVQPPVQGCALMDKRC
jgi:hypothetical protein